MKRDPLQRGPTAYDVLGVGPDAGNDEIDRAVSAGAGPGEAAAAAEDLRDPARRALIDLFLYQDRYLDDLAFDDPLETLSETGARRAAAERWRAVEKRGFPMPAATHSIAVLSYWEARGSGRNGPDLPTSPDVTGRLWEAALSRFAALCASEAFWTEWGVVTGNRGVGEAAAAALESGLVDELEEMAATVRGRGDVPGEARVREHLALFRSELRSARALPALRVLSGRGLSPAAITAGPHLLAEIGLLEKVQAAVEAQHPDLLRLFSPLAHIGLLVEEKEYGSAYGALERLDPAAREAPEARELETRVHLELGLAALAADRTDEALGHWERAIDRAEVRSWVAAPVSEAALTRAKLLHSREDRDGAILLLQRTLPLAERGILGVPLAHFLLERANGRIERATAGAGDGEADLGPAIAEARGAVADLEEAVLLDPTNGEIRDRRNEAEDLLRGLVARAGPEAVEVGEQADAPPAADTPTVEPEPAAAVQPPIATRGSVLVAAGVTLWVGIGLLAFVAYPLLMPQHLGGTGTIIALGVAVGWIATNAVGWVLLR
jgi:tetratricopeptide (TPR) repeat protein